MNQVISEYLKSYLEVCFVNIDSSKLQTSLFSGSIKFSDLQISEEFVKILLSRIYKPLGRVYMIEGFCKQLVVQVRQFNINFFQFSVMSFQSKPLEIIVREVNIELGLKQLSREQNYNDSHSDQLSYDSINAFDIFKHKLDIKQENQAYFDVQKNHESQYSSLLKNLIIKIEKVRVKFTDRFFSFQNFAYGIGCTISQVVIKMSQETQNWDFEIIGLKCYTEWSDKILAKNKKIQNVFLTVDPVLRGKYSQDMLSYQLHECVVSLNSDSIKCIRQFQESLSFQEYWEDLQGYKPLKRPIVGIKQYQTSSSKRRLIVRDWFHYVVWFVRIRKLKQQGKHYNFSSNAKLNIQFLNFTVYDNLQPLVDLKISKFYYQIIDRQQSLTIGQLIFNQFLQETNIGEFKSTFKDNRQTGLLDSKQIFTASGKQKGISQLHMSDFQQKNQTQTDYYQQKGSKFQGVDSISGIKQHVNSLSNLLSNFRGKNDSQNSKLTNQGSSKPEQRTIVLLEIKGSESQNALSICKNHLKLGEVDLVDLRTEQLLKLTEVLLKIVDVKLVVKEWIPELYFKNYLRSLRMIVQSIFINRNRSSESNSLISENDDFETSKVGWSLRHLLLHKNFEMLFEITKFQLRLSSFSTQVIEISQILPYQLSIKVLGSKAELKIGNGLVIQCPNSFNLVDRILFSINLQLQPIFMIASYDENLAKLRQIIREKLLIQNSQKNQQHQSANMHYQTLYNQLQSEECNWNNSNEKSSRLNKYLKPSQVQSTYQTAVQNKRKIDQDLPVPNFSNFDQNKMSDTMQNYLMQSSSSKFLVHPKTTYFTKVSKESRKPNVFQVTTSSGRNSVIEKQSTNQVPNFKMESVAPRLPHQSILKKSLVTPQSNLN